MFPSAPNCNIPLSPSSPYPPLKKVNGSRLADSKIFAAGKDFDGLQCREGVAHPFPFPFASFVVLPFWRVESRSAIHPYHIGKNILGKNILACGRCLANRRTHYRTRSPDPVYFLPKIFLLLSDPVVWLRLMAAPGAHRISLRISSAVKRRCRRAPNCSTIRAAAWEARCPACFQLKPLVIP